ncbi:LysR substrate-binding domain-containing protein [Cognatishimia sp. MH4019]|uniref:LysR substrate-binding domain-containing protein n=1 Tax=Cognatishimia sp. MH4019 TaxID=2854030 RepID=UPI001CD7ECB4|nr:LysR substrate-binding domain-containing protein [Cognatishimia sp. MH4019]
MKNITLKQLRYFEALARHKHFGRAADASAISQPALSMRIKELETSLGTALFERGPRQVSLTAFGEEFAPRARDILRAVDELGEMARAATTGLSGRLRIGVIPTIAPYLLPALIGELTRAHPQVDMQIRETVTPRLLEELQDGLLDTAILALPIEEPTLVETPLFEEAMMLVRPKAEADAPVPGKDKLREMRLLLLEEGHCFRDQALSYCDMPAQQPRAGLDGSSLSTLVQMVGAGIGVTLIPEMAVRVETRSAPVCVGHFAGEPPKRTVGMVWRKTHPLATQLEEVAAIVKRAAVSLIDGVTD